MAPPSHHDIVNLTIMPEETSRKIGRRPKYNKATKNKKKKQPRRGMGVEQLERLRMQDQNIIKYHPLNLQSPYIDPHLINTPSSFAATNPNISILNTCPSSLHLNPASVVQQRAARYASNGPISSHDQYQIQKGLYGFTTCTNRNENSKELSSMPNLMSNKKSCFSQHCLKKRVINGEDMGTRRYQGELIHVEKMSRQSQDFGNAISKASVGPDKAVSSIEKDVEIVAIHRKGSSSLSAVMEYGFFPKKGGTSNSYYSDNKVMMSSSLSESTVVSGEASSSVTTVSRVVNTSIDLSLKLSL